MAGMRTALSTGRRHAWLHLAACSWVVTLAAWIVVSRRTSVLAAFQSRGDVRLEYAGTRVRRKRSVVLEYDGRGPSCSKTTEEVRRTRVPAYSSLTSSRLCRSSVALRLLRFSRGGPPSPARADPGGTRGGLGGRSVDDDCGAPGQAGVSTAAWSGAAGARRWHQGST